MANAYLLKVKLMVETDLNAPHNEVMDDFGEMLLKLLRNNDLNMSEFARMTDYSREHIRKIVRGETTPPLKEIDRWADLLNLKEGGDTRQTFVDLAKSTRAKSRSETAPYVDDVERKLEKLETKFERMGSLTRMMLSMLREMVVTDESRGLVVPRGIKKAIQEVEEFLDSI